VLYTIVIPVYNGEETIVNALDSAVYQSVKPTKIIVYNNGSTDRTKTIVNEYIKKIKNIQIEQMISKINYPPQLSFLKSLEKVSGRFIWLAADDELIPNAIQSLLSSKCSDNCDHFLMHKPLFIDKELAKREGYNFSHLKDRDNYQSGFLRFPADNSLHYGLLDAQIVKKNIDLKINIAWDWYLTYKLAKYKFHYFEQYPIMVRDWSGDEKHIDNLRNMQKKGLPIFPLKDFTLKMIKDRDIKISSMIVRLICLNAYRSLTIGKYAKHRFSKRILSRIEFIQDRSDRTALEDLFQLIFKYKIERKPKGKIINKIPEINYFSIEKTPNQMDWIQRFKISSNLFIKIDYIHEFNASVKLLKNVIPSDGLKITFILPENASNYFISRFYQLIFIGNKMNIRVEIVKKMNKSIKFINIKSIWLNSIDDYFKFNFKIKPENQNKSTFNIFLPVVPEIGRDSGSTDVIFLLVLLKKMKIETNIFINNFEHYPETTGKFLIENLATHINKFKNITSKNKNFVYGPYALIDYFNVLINIKFIYIMVDFVKIRYFLQKENGFIEDQKVLVSEQYALRESETVFAISERDIREITNLEPYSVSDKVRYFPMIRFPKDSGCANSQERFKIVFIGSFNHPPNQIMVKNLTNEIAMELNRNKKEVEIHIGGKGFTNSKENLENVKILGYIEDLNNFYDSAIASIVPVGIGSGINGKLIESLCYGVIPIVHLNIYDALPEFLRPFCVSYLNVSDIPKCVDISLSLYKKINQSEFINLIHTHFSGQRNYTEIRRVINE
jgi:glycosyltransferase involved in cell wall biosynthesis